MKKHFYFCMSFILSALKHPLRFKIPDLVRKLVISWLFAVTVEYFLLTSDLRNLAALNGLSQMSLGRVAIISIVAILLLELSSFCVNTIVAERWFLAGIFATLIIAALHASFSWEFLTLCILIVAGLVVFGIYGWDKSLEPVITPVKTHKAFLRITFTLSLIFFLFVSVWTVCRVYSFSTPTYDFGIFSQMFHNMKKSCLPITTLERDGLLSHFSVHVSPIYYLLLPFYCLMPTPATLQVLQAAVITSSIIPLWKLGKHHGLGCAQRMLVCTVLLLYPAFSGGTSYDIHENCFLAPLILWLFYGIDKKNTAITAVSALLTLMVKEDAAVYVAVTALWLITKTAVRFKKTDLKNLITGVILLGIALICFFLTTKYLTEVGDGIMTNRYNNFMYDGSSSLVTVIKSVVLCPMKAFYECVDSEKIKFIALTLLPLLGMPLLTRRYERYILLIPYILVNLMSDYPYQHDVFFQYTFGSTACLMYLAVINMADFKITCQSIFLTIMVVISIVCFTSIIIPKAKTYPEYCLRYSDYYQNIRNTLSLIPDDASVTATTFYTTFLSQREVLYDLEYASREHMLETEYIAISVSATSNFKKYATAGKENGFDNLINLLEQNDYELYAELTDVLVIYRKK